MIHIDKIHTPFVARRRGIWRWFIFLLFTTSAFVMAISTHIFGSLYEQTLLSAATRIYSGKDSTLSAISAPPMTFILPDSNNATCQPYKNIVFIKTGKTGGSTMASIINRFGLKYNLVAAVNPDKGAFISEDETAKHYIIKKYNCSDFPGYNIMASHICYNRPAMEEVVLNAKYVTIVRSPYAHFKSAFYFSGRDQNYPNSSNPFRDYLKYLYDTYGAHGHGTVKLYLRKFRLVLTPDDELMKKQLERLNGELDLVMLTEYYDESLVLLKKLMCWDFDDIVYFPMKVHHEYQPPITKDMEHIIKKLSRLDIEFYEYFNNTFWEKVKNYDGDFKADLEEFQRRKNRVTRKCPLGNETSYCELLHLDALKSRNRLAEENAIWNC